MNVFHAHCVLIQLIEVRINIFSISLFKRRNKIWNLRFLSLLRSMYVKRDESYNAGHYWEFSQRVYKMEKLSNRRSILIITKKNVIEFHNLLDMWCVWLYIQIYHTHTSPDGFKKTSIGNYIPLEFIQKISLDIKIKHEFA